MFKYIRKGFGLTVGYILATVVIGIACDATYRWVVKDEDFMNKLKEKDPEKYEKLKKQYS